jgi:hypothetical protein
MSERPPRGASIFYTIPCAGVCWPLVYTLADARWE